MPRARRTPPQDERENRQAGELEVTAFNPLHPRVLGDSVSRELLRQPCDPLPPELPFEGAGVYAIYYHGDSPYYKAIAELNRGGCEQPIYVGKADPPGRRKGIFVEKPGRVLYQRLRADHAESIGEVEANTPSNHPGHLRLADFKCRFLVVEPIWIPLIESLSITNFRPAWNGLIDGFGHHDQGATRRTQQRSFWDTLHPGRQWATPFTANSWSPDMIASVLEKWLKDPTVQIPTRTRAGSRRGRAVTWSLDVGTEETVVVPLEDESGS